MFHTRWHVQMHLKSHQKEGLRRACKYTSSFVLRYECPVCANMFHTRWHVQMHLKSHQKEGFFTHTKEKPFICQQCGKGFITKGKLKRHLETHQGLKKFQCHICCKFFTRPSYMRIHVRTIHGTQDYNFTDYGVVAKSTGVAPDAAHDLVQFSQQLRDSRVLTSVETHQPHHLIE
ncbi:Uncharacterized protein OBRU01_03368, partial [Operophtera brumata]